MQGTECAASTFSLTAAKGGAGGPGGYPACQQLPASRVCRRTLHLKHQPGLRAADADLLDARLAIGAGDVPHDGGSEPGIAFLHLDRTFGLHLTLAGHRRLVVDLDLVLEIGRASCRE